MKRWKITVKREHDIVVFQSPEGLYTWKTSDGSKKRRLTSPEYEKCTSRMSFERGETVYVEWLGSEYVYDEQSNITVTMRNVRFVSMKSLSPNLSSFAEITDAWVTDELLKLSGRCSHDTRNMRIDPMTIEEQDSDTTLCSIVKFIGSLQEERLITVGA